MVTVANTTLTKEKDQDTNLTNEVRGEKTGDVLNESGNERQTDGPGLLSFLGARPTIPPLPDSPEPSSLSKSEEHPLVAEIPFGTKDSPVDGVEQGPLPPQVNSVPRNSPTVNSSPTAVPFASRRNPRFRPPLQSRTKTRPRSTGFRSSEFRPLYLVARHTPRQETSIENYYSLPSSHSTSRTSSIQDPQEYDIERSPNQIEALDLFDPIKKPHSEGRQLLIDTHHSLQGLDLLDSAQPTPTARSFQAAGQRDASPQAKTMHDLDSTLITLPSSPSPSFTNFKHDLSSTSQYRGQELIRDRIDFSSDHDWKNNLPEYPFKLTEDLPPLPSSRGLSPDSVSDPNSLESIIQPIIHSKHEFELPHDLPPLPGSRASSLDLDDKLDEPNKKPQPSLRSTENDFERPKDSSDLSSSRPLSPDPCIEPAEQQFISPSKQEFDIPEDFPSLPSSRVSSPELAVEFEKLKTTPQSTRDIGIPGDLSPLPRSRTSTPDLDVQIDQSIQLPQLIRGFESPRNFPAVPSSRVVSPDNDFESPPEPKTITRRAYSFQAPDDLPTLPSSRASSPDIDAELRNRVSRRQPVNEFEQFEDFLALPRSRASSPDAGANYNLELERGAAPQPIFGLERSEILPPLPSSRASSLDFDADFNVEPITYPQSKIEFQPSENLPALPSSRASSPDVYVFHEMKTPLEPTLKFPLSENLPVLPSSRASSPDADIFHDTETKIPLELTLESHGSEDLPVLPVSRATSLEAYSTHDIKTKIPLEPTFEFQESEDRPRMPSGRGSSPQRDTYHDVENKRSLQPTNLIPRLEDLPALPPSRAPSPNSSNETELISNKMGPKLMAQEKIVPNLDAGLVSDDVTGAINAEIAESSKAPIEKTLQSPDLLTSGGNSLDYAKGTENSLQGQTYVENADLLSTPEKVADIEPTSLLQVSLSSGTLTKGKTGDEVVAVMAAVAEGGANTQVKRPTTNLKKVRKNQKKAKQGDRAQASISEESDRASAQQQEGMEDDLSSQSFASKDSNMPSGENLVDATDLSIPGLGTELSRGENIQIEENAPPVKKCKKGKKNKKQAVKIGPSPKSVVTDDSSTKPDSQAAHAAVLTPIAGDFDMEGAQLGGPSVEIVDQKSPETASQSETPPEAISLPIDDDLELLEALPRSPSVRPSDRSSSPDSFPETTALPTDNHQKTALQTERPPEAVKLPSDTDVDLLAPTHYVETTDRGRYKSAQPKNNEDHEPSAMVAELHNSALKPDIVPELVESTARDDLEEVETSPQSALLEKTDETSQEQSQVKENLSEMPNTPITESLKPDLEPNLAAQFIALPPNDDLDLLEASPPKPSTELTHTEWLEKPEPLTNESPESVPAHEITSRAGPLPDNDDLDLQKASPQSPSIGSTEQRSYRPKLGEFKHSEEIEPFTQLSSVLAPKFIALPSDSDSDLLESSPRMPSKEVPQLNAQLDESKGDAEASSLRSPETPIIPAEDITAMADHDLDVVEQDLPMKYSSPAEEPIAKLPQDVREIRAYPETVALPVDNDLDLLEAIPPSPPTDSQPKLIDEPSLRSPTEIFGPNFTPYIFVSRAAKGFRPPSAPPTGSFAGQMPTITEEVLEQEVSPESFTLPPDDDLDLVEEVLASPEPKFHSSRELNEIEATPYINPDKELDLPDALPLSPLSEGIDEPPEEILETEVNPETIELPDDEDLDLLGALPPSPSSDASQVPQVGCITLPGTLPSSSPAEQISRTPKELLERNVNPKISEIPADKELDSRRAIPPSSPVDSPLNPVKEQNFRLPEDLLASEITPEPITLPADKDFDLLEALPPNTWAGSQQSSGKEASSTSFTNIPEAKNVSQKIRDYHDLAEALPPSASEERVQYQPEQQEKLRSRSLKEPSEPEITPQAVQLPYNDDLDLLEPLPPSPLASPTPELEERITKSLESERVTPRSPLSRSVEPKDYHSEPAEELVSKSLEPEVNLEASKLPVGDSLDSLDTLPPSPSTKLTEHETRSMEEPIPISPELAPSTVACADGDPGLLESRPEIFSADHQTRSVEEPIPTLPERAPSTVACADGDPGLLESRPEIFSADHQTRSVEEPIPTLPERAPSTVACADGDPGLLESRPEIFSAGHQTQSLEGPILELLEPARSTVACADGDLGVPETRPRILSIDRSSQQTDLLDERISKWQNELVAESQLPPESIQLPSDGDSEVLAALPPKPIKPVIIDEVELRPLDQASQPRDASPHALEPLKEIYFQFLPKDLPLPADDGLDLLEAQPESPLPEPQVVPKDLPLPTDNDLDLLEALTESPLSESQVVPEDLPLPTDDDLDLLEALPESPLPESQVVPKNSPLRTDGGLELSEALPKSPSSESNVVPEDLPLPTDDDIDLLEGLPGSPLPESQVAPKDFPPPTNDDLDLLEELPESTLSESRVVPEDMPLPTDIDLDLLEAPPNSSLPESQIVPKDFPLPTDDELGLLGTLPESPSLQSSNIYSDKLETQHLEVKEHDPDAHHNPIIPEFLEPEDAPENLQSPANDDLDLEISSQSSLARLINPENTDIALLKEEVKGEVAEGFEGVTDNANKYMDKVKPTKSIGVALSGVLMKEKSKRVTSEEPEMLDNDGDFSKKSKRNTTKGKNIQEESSKSGLILEEVEPPKASVATLPLDGSNEASESSENLVRNAEVEGSSEQQTMEDDWAKEPEKKGKKGKKGQKAEGNSPPLKGSTETTKPPSSETMLLDHDFEDSQAQAVTEDEGQKETKKKGKRGKKSKDKKSKPSTRTPGLPPMTSPGIDAAQLKAFEPSPDHPDHPADTKDEASFEDKVEEAGVKRTSSSEDAETAEFQPGQPESEENVLEVAFKDPQAEDELPGSNKKRARKEKKRKSKLTDTYREGSDSEKAETSHALSEPRSELVDQLVESRGTEAVEEPRQNQDFTETMGLEPEQVEPRQAIREEALPEATIDDGPAEPVRNGSKGKKVMSSKQGLEDDATTLAEVTRSELEPTQTMPDLESELPMPNEVRPKEDDDQHIGAQQIEPENIAPDFSFAKSIESGQVEPDHLESRFADLEESQLAQSHLAEIKDIASGQPKSHLMEENPAEISLKVEPEPIKKENSTFNAASPARETKGSTPTPQEPDYTEPIPNKVAAPVDNTTRKTPSSIFDYELPLDLQAVEHSPNPEKNLATTNVMTPTSAVENNLLDTEEYLPLVPEPATLTELPPSTDQHQSILENSPFTATESSFTEPLEKSPITAGQPSVREDDSVAETPSSEKPPVTISNAAALRPLSADTYPVPVEELTIIGSSDKALVPLEEPIDIDPLSSGKALINPEEVPVIDVPSVDGYPATAKEQASFESHHSPDYVKEPPVKDLDVSPADKSMIGFEEPFVRNMASPDKCLPVPEDPSVMEVLSPDNALVTLEEPAVIDARSSNISLVHVEEPSVTKSGPPEKSVIPVQEPSTTESPASGKSPLTMEEFSIITAEEPTNLEASLSVAKEHLSDIEVSSIGPENPTSSASEPPLNIQKEPISEQNTDGHSTVEDLTPISLRDIESSPVIDIPAKLCQEDLPSNTNQVPENILPQDESATAKKSKKGKKSKETVTPGQELTASDGSSAKIKQETKSQNPDEDSPLLENIIAVPKTKKGKDKKALKGTKQEDELHLADLVPITSEEISVMSSNAGSDQFDDDLVASAVLEKQDYEPVLPGEDPIVPIKRGKKGKKSSKARQQADDDFAQPEEDPIITPEDPSAFLEKQYDELKQPEDDAITPESLSAALKEQGEIDESIAPVKKTKKGKKGSKSRKQGVVGKLDQPEEDPITSQDLSTGPKRQEVGLDQIEVDPNATKDLSGVPEKQDGFDQPAAPLKKAARGKEGKKDRKREVDEIDQPEHSSAVLDELQAKKEDPLTPEDHIAVSEKQEGELQLEEDPIAPEDLHTVSGTQEDELQPKEDPITPEDFPIISEKQEDELQIKENRITPHDLFATPDTREDELEIKEDSFSPENFLDGLKTREDVLQIREGTITPENLSAGLQAQEDELLTITPENFSVGPETQEDQVDQSPNAPDRVTPEDPSAISNKQGDRNEEPIAPNPAAPEDLSAAPEKLEDEPEQLDEEPTKKERRGKKGKKGSKARKQEVDEPEQREDDFTATEKQDQVDGPISADRVTPDYFSAAPAIQGDRLEETPIATNPITPEDLSSAVPESQVYELEQLEDDPIAPENSSAVKKAKKGRKGKKREFFDKPCDLVTSEDHSAPSEKQEAEHDQLGKKTKKGKKGKPKRQRLDYLPEEDPITPEDTSATELKQTDQLDRPEEDLSAVQTEEDPVISRDLSAVHTKQIDPLDQPDDPIISEDLSASIVDKLNQTQEDPITWEELSAPTIGKLDHPKQESIHLEERCAVPTTKTIDENTEDPAECEPVVSEDTFPPLEDYELDQPGQGYIASADIVVPPKAKIKKGKKEKHVDRLGPADQTFLSPGDASASQDELFDQPDQSNIASEESAPPEEQSAEIPLKRKSKNGKKSKQYENFDRSDKRPITPEETIASLENIPNVPLSAEGSQDEESIQKSLAPVAPGDTDTPQEDIYAIPKKNRGKMGRKAKQDDVIDQSNAAGRVASGDGLTLQDDFPNTNEEDARLDQTELDPLSPRDLPDPLFSKNETQQRERSEPGSEPSDEASLLQEDFPEIAIAKRNKKYKRGKKGSQADKRAIPEETIATDANAGGSELLPDDTRDLALEPISQQLSANIPKPQAEPQHEEMKEAEAGQQKSLRTQTPVAEDSHMNNSLDVSLGVHAEEATSQGHLVKPQAEREFEDAGIRGEDNSLLIGGYREATHSDLSRQHPTDQREPSAEAVQALQTPVSLDSMPSDVPFQLQSQSPLRELADLDVEHTVPTEILTSYDANPSVDPEKDDERRLMPDASQIVHPSDRIVLSSTPSLVTDSAEAQESKGLAEVEQQKSPGLKAIPSETDLNRSTYFESLTEPENYVPELPPIDPAFGKSTPVEELSAPEWGLKPTKKSKKEKKLKNKALDSDSLNTGEILERGSADVSEGATVAGDLDLKPTEGLGENLPEITLTEADVEKSTPVEEQGVPDWGLTPTRRSKKEKKSKKKALNSDSSGTREILEPKSADISKAATLTGDLDLKLTKKLEEDLPQITLAEADVEKSTSVEEQSAPEWGLTPVGKSKKEKKSKKALDSDSSGTREILDAGPSALGRDIDLKPVEGLLTEPQQDVPELPLAKANAAEELSVPETDLKFTKKSKKEKKSKKKALDIDSLTTREILERKKGDIPKYFTRDVDFKPSDELAEPEQDMPEQLQVDENAEKSTNVEGSAITELRSRASKKGKEDKESKGRASDSVFTEEMLDPAPSETTAMEALAEQNLPKLSNTEESIPNDDSAIPKSGFKPSKKSKKDKKSKDRATASSSLVPEASELLIETPKEQILPEILNAHESISIEDSEIPESGPLPSERSKKDKKSKNKPIVNDSIVTEETFEPTVSETPTGIPDEQIVTEFWSTKNKKGKKAEKQNLEIDRGPSSIIGDNVERGPAETPSDTSAEPNIPEHEPSTKRKKSKQSKKQVYELGANFTPLDTEPVPQTNQQVAEAGRSAGSADHVDNKEDSRSIDPTQHESERQQTLMPEREISLDEREQIHNSPLVDTDDEIGAENISDKMAGFKSEAPTPEESTPGESTPGESTPAESINRDSMVPQSDSPQVSVILPVQNDSRDTEARALENQYPEFVQEESQPHLEDEKHSSGREIEAQELSRKPFDSATESTFNISVEVDSSYGVSISTPSSKRKRSLAVSTPARNDEEIFPDSTRGIESLQTEEQPFQDPGEPSLVSPTTKERSSALFQSSPSTREDFINRRPEPESPLHDPAEIEDVEFGNRDLPDWTQPADFPINKSRTIAPTPIDLNIWNMDEKRGPSDSRSLVSPVSPITPIGFREERSPSRSPFVSDISDRSRLNTIVEYSPKESPLHKKSRSVSDVGSPERGVKFRRRSAVPQQTSQARMQSPLNPENTARLTGPFEDLTYRLSWPKVDEDNHTVDLERSGSRERRTPSGASVGSVESINAIIKTPEVKSSGTPPLRRTDRSVSGDLREAHKKGGAKKLAKLKEAERQLDIAIPSSSTYDPTKDKGKRRVDDMAAVYVSITFHFRIIIYQNHRQLMCS